MSGKISYTDIASIILKEINQVRSDPTSLIPYLEARRKKYRNGNYEPLEGLSFSVKTQEGAEGVSNLIMFLRSHRKCP